jgi:hypothetical protein
MQRIVEDISTQTNAFSDLRNSVVKFRTNGFSRFIENLFIVGGLGF